MIVVGARKGTLAWVMVLALAPAAIGGTTAASAGPAARAAGSCGTTRTALGAATVGVGRSGRPTCLAAFSITKAYFRRLGRAISSHHGYPAPYYRVGAYRCTSYSAYRGMDCSGPRGRHLYAELLAGSPTG